MSNGPVTEKHTLYYQRDQLDPKEWLNFVELDPFVPAWKRLGLTDLDLRALQLLICASPDRAPVMGGTGGLRKLRFAPSSWNCGSSGAARVYYTYFPEYGLIALVYAHSKDEMEEISEGQKRQIKRTIQEIQTYLDGNPVAHGKLS